MAVTLPNGLIIPGSYGPTNVAPDTREMIEHYYPHHKGHVLWTPFGPGSATDLSVTYWCGTCGCGVRISVVAEMAYKPKGTWKDGVYTVPDNRAQWKKDGLCPECGHRGDWINMAAVCPTHGKFMG